MPNDDYARKYMGDFQLLAIRCGALYGALALAGLIVTNLVCRTAYSELGALAACVAALMAYANFTIASVKPQSGWITATQALSILFGLASGAAVVAGLL